MWSIRNLVGWFGFFLLSFIDGGYGFRSRMERDLYYFRLKWLKANRLPDDEPGMGDFLWGKGERK